MPTRRQAVFEPEQSSEPGVSAAMKARIYLRRVAADLPEYLGEQEVDSIPVLNGLVRLVTGGQPQLLRVNRLEPRNWNPASEAIPVIHAVPALAVPKPD
jgi:hypothetical protein